MRSPLGEVRGSENRRFAEDKSAPSYAPRFAEKISQRLHTPSDPMATNVYILVLSLHSERFGRCPAFSVSEFSKMKPEYLGVKFISAISENKAILNYYSAFTSGHSDACAMFARVLEKEASRSPQPQHLYRSPKARNLLRECPLSHALSHHTRVNSRKISM